MTVKNKKLHKLSKVDVTKNGYGQRLDPLVAEENLRVRVERVQVKQNRKIDR